MGGELGEDLGPEFSEMVERMEAGESPEDLGLPGDLHPVQEAFIAEAGFQCSYCTPGFILTAKALLDERPNATDEEILQAFKFFCEQTRNGQNSR